MRVESAGRVIELVQGDITREQTDAIVNAANAELLGGGGVDGAIHRAGGPAILEECRAHRQRLGGPLPPGDAVVTTGGRLSARYVIHTAGPVWRGGSSGEADHLARCYRSSLRSADELGLQSVSFPSISTGVFGYPLGRASAVAVAAVRDGLADAASIRMARFVLFDSETFSAYAAALGAFG
jgi:O-acetyl-ADP-ribose deacetylase (regulator of RNase III)